MATIEITIMYMEMSAKIRMSSVYIVQKINSSVLGHLRFFKTKTFFDVILGLR